MTDLDDGDRRLPALPARRARAGAGDDPCLPRRPARLRRGRGASRTGLGDARRGPAPPRCLGPARPAVDPALADRLRRRAASHPGLLPLRLRRRPDRDRRRRAISTCRGRPRLLPETLDVDEVERLLEAPRRAGRAVRIRDRALLELLYAAGLRISEALGLDREDLSLDGGFVRVIGKGDRERLVPVGEVALDWLRPLARRRPRRPGSRSSTSRRCAAVRCSSATAAAGSRASRPGRSSSAAAAERRPAGARHAAHPPPLVRDPSARGRRRPAGRPGVARTCEYLHDPAVHPSHGRADPRGLRPGPPAGLKEEQRR